MSEEIIQELSLEVIKRIENGKKIAQELKKFADEKRVNNKRFKIPEGMPYSGNYAEVRRYLGTKCIESISVTSTSAKEKDWFGPDFKPLANFSFGDRDASERLWHIELDAFNPLDSEYLNAHLDNDGNPKIDLLYNTPVGEKDITRHFVKFHNDGHITEDSYTTQGGMPLMYKYVVPPKRSRPLFSLVVGAMEDAAKRLSKNTEQKVR